METNTGLERLEQLEALLSKKPGVESVVFTDPNGLPLRGWSRNEQPVEKIAATAAGLMGSAGIITQLESAAVKHLRVRTNANTMIVSVVTGIILVACIVSGSEESDRFEFELDEILNQ